MIPHQTRTITFKKGIIDKHSEILNLLTITNNCMIFMINIYNKLEKGIIIKHNEIIQFTNYNWKFITELWFFKPNLLEEASQQQ